MFLYDASSSPFERELILGTPGMGTGEFFGLSVAHAFERHNTIGLWNTESKIRQADEAEGTYDPLFNTDLGLGEGPMPHKFAMGKEEWEKSEWFDSRIAYVNNMTPARARILKNDLDRRDAEARELAINTTGIGRKALGFGAGLVAGLPDPVNLIPVGVGGVAKSAGQAVFRGAFSGAASNLLASAVTLPVAERWGEDVTWKDYALDTMFGAVLGGALGGGAHWLGDKLRARAARRSEAEALPAALAMEKTRLEARDDLRGSLLEAGFTGEEALAKADDVFRGLEKAGADIEDIRSLRGTLSGQGRVKIGQMLDRVNRAISEDQPLDVGAWAKELGMENHVFRTAAPRLDTAPLVRPPDAMAGDLGRPLWPRDMDFAEMLPMAEAWYMEKLAGTVVETERGPVTFRGKRGWKEIHQDLSPDKVRLIPFLDKILEIAQWGEPGAARRAIHQRHGMLSHPLRAAVDLDGRTLDVRLTVREDVNGKLFYDFAELGEAGKKTTPPESSRQAAVAGTKGGERAEGGAYLGSQNGPSAERGVSSGSSGSVSLHIDPPEGPVNISVRDITPDFRPEPKETFGPAQDTPKTPRDELIAAGIDPASGKSFAELDVERLAKEGRVLPEEMAELEARRHEVEAVNREEEAALSVLGCITETHGEG